MVAEETTVVGTQIPINSFMAHLGRVPPNAQPGRMFAACRGNQLLTLVAWATPTGATMITSWSH